MENARIDALWLQVKIIMRIIYAISGEEIAEVEDPLGNARDAKVAASEALGVHPALLRVRVTQCSVLVISGKILCRRYRCAARVTCSCRAPEDVCRCEVVQSDVTDPPPLCDACEKRDRQAEDAEETWRNLKNNDFGRW